MDDLMDAAREDAKKEPRTEKKKKKHKKVRSNKESCDWILKTFVCLCDFLHNLFSQNAAAR